jgi:anhydro-N-acetylmuramic acid kinase
MNSKQLYIGIMSGTSLDGVDCALVDFSSDRCRVIEAVCIPFPTDLRSKLQTICSQETVTFDALGTLDIRLAQLYANAVHALLDKTGMLAAAITAIGCHGQTIRHRPPLAHDSAIQPYTLQIGDPNTLAELTGITTVADFRRRDIAAGGQGAPLVPAFHAQVMHAPAEHRVILNIGGIANITVLPRAGSVSGFDTGPGNVLIDGWMEQHYQQTYDHSGKRASGGRVHAELLQRLLTDPYFEVAPPKSTGREYFNQAWLQKNLRGLSVNPLDALTTLTQLTANSIAAAIQKFANNTQQVLVCGGGAHNTFLQQLLAAQLPNCKIASTETVGLHPDYVEAAAFAWLAKQTLEHKPGNLPSVTGANKAVILGGVYYA